MNVIDEDEDKNEAEFQVLDFIPIENVGVDVHIDIVSDIENVTIDVSVDNNAYTCFIKVKDNMYLCSLFKGFKYDVVVKNFKRTSYVKYNKRHSYIELYDNNSLLETYNSVLVHITESEIASMLLLSQGA